MSSKWWKGIAAYLGHYFYYQESFPKIVSQIMQASGYISGGCIKIFQPSSVFVSSHQRYVWPGIIAMEQKSFSMDQF